MSLVPKSRQVTAEIEKIDTDKQVADHLTKNLEADKLVETRMMMFGW